MLLGRLLNKRSDFSDLEPALGGLFEDVLIDEAQEYLLGFIIA